MRFAIYLALALAGCVGGEGEDQPKRECTGYVWPYPEAISQECRAVIQCTYGFEDSARVEMKQYDYGDDYACRSERFVE